MLWYVGCCELLIQIWQKNVDVSTAIVWGHQAEGFMTRGHWIMHLGGQLPKKAKDGHTIRLVLSNHFQNWYYKLKSIEKWMRYGG